METLQRTIERILENCPKESLQQEKDLTSESGVECSVCNDTEWIYFKENNSAMPCKCREVKRYKKIIESSGISKAFQTKTINNFTPTNKETAIAKAMAENYINSFDIKSENNSIAFLGTVGSGKTHLSIAIANELMKKNIGVMYMQYREDITKIKQVAKYDEDYQRAINKYKKATVLLIDDLYKNATYKINGVEEINEADKRAMFEIVNYRYFNNLPMIISSEYSSMAILGFDEAIGSRILERCDGKVAEISNAKSNYRIYKGRT